MRVLITRDFKLPFAETCAIFFQRRITLPYRSFSGKMPIVVLGPNYTIFLIITSLLYYSVLRLYLDIGQAPPKFSTHGPDSSKAAISDLASHGNRLPSRKAAARNSLPLCPTPKPFRLPLIRRAPRRRPHLHAPSPPASLSSASTS